MDAGLASGGSAAGRDAGLADGEVVWSWRRDRGVYPPRLCGVGNGDNKRRSPGRARISRNTIARGKPGCLGCTCGLTRVLFSSAFSHTGLRAQSAPGFPCALFSREGQRNGKTPGTAVPRDRSRLHRDRLPLAGDLAGSTLACSTWALWGVKARQRCRGSHPPVQAVDLTDGWCRARSNEKASPQKKRRSG